MRSMSSSDFLVGLLARKIYHLLRGIKQQQAVSDHDLFGCSVSLVPALFLPAALYYVETLRTDRQTDNPSPPTVTFALKSPISPEVHYYLFVTTRVLARSMCVFVVEPFTNILEATLLILGTTTTYCGRRSNRGQTGGSQYRNVLFFSPNFSTSTFCCLGFYREEGPTSHHPFASSITSNSVH